MEEKDKKEINGLYAQDRNKRSFVRKRVIICLM